MVDARQKKVAVVSWFYGANDIDNTPKLFLMNIEFDLNLKYVRVSFYEKADRQHSYFQRLLFTLKKYDFCSLLLWNVKSSICTTNSIKMHAYISLLKIITVYQISFSPFLPRIIKRKNLFSKDQKKLYGLI